MWNYKFDDKNKFTVFKCYDFTNDEDLGAQILESASSWSQLMWKHSQLASLMILDSWVVPLDTHLCFCLLDILGCMFDADA